MRNLLECAAVQQAESSASRRRGQNASRATQGAPPERRGESVHQPLPEANPAATAQRAPPLAVGEARSIHQRVGPVRDARDTLNARRRSRADRADGADRGYHVHRGGRYDSGEDRSPSPGAAGPRAFSARILNAPFPPRFRQPTSIAKYSGETNPGVWLSDYRLACQAGGADDDLFIICNLPLFLADSTRAWLEHIPSGRVRSWNDLKEVFIGNFQGTYTRPGNSWDLRSCRQGADESLRDYIRRFSRKRTELSKVADADVIGAFLAGTSCRPLVHELGRRGSRTMEELLNIATSYASGKEAVGAIFDRSKGKAKREEDAGEGTSNRQQKKKGKLRRKAPLVAAVERKRGQPPPRGHSRLLRQTTRGNVPEPRVPREACLQRLQPHEEVLCGQPDERRPEA